MEKYIELIEAADIENFKLCIEPEESLSHLVDAKNQSLLHASAICGVFNILESLLQHESHILTIEKLDELINLKNTDGNTAFMFAAMGGYNHIMELLIKHGSEIHTLNSQGKNAVHLAAEKDFAHTVAFLAERNVKLTKHSLNKDTPLHLAVDMNAYKTVSLLIAMKISKRKIDGKGRTALHIASKNNNSKLVRLLMLKGFNRYAKDLEGKIPKDLATEKETIILFNANGFLELFGYRGMIDGGGKKNFLPFSVLCFLLLTVVIVDGIFLENCKDYIDNSKITYILSGIALVDVALIVFLITSDPGYVAKGDPNNLIKLYSDSTNEVCPECFIVRPERSRHCFFCRRCVIKYDHHCQWVNNCIGARNLGAFYTFLLLTLASCILLLYQCINAFILSNSENTIDNISRTAFISVTSFLCILGFGAFIMIFRLYLLHTKNFFLGKTSSERFSRSGLRLSQITTPSLKNFFTMFCNL
ncbi:hypothetical protein SteCoe_5046 [Stentor coeruleus]|uniref:Palmitoyltransferase n=1 Tax=Stentor coeruleus TaxID=5963 RepID=A0A1R2CTG1_9CILI|nr:hypothetical protein SteCoe_5046 [Stentor coeruleus]